MVQSGKQEQFIISEKYTKSTVGDYDMSQIAKFVKRKYGQDHIRTFCQGVLIFYFNLRLKNLLAMFLTKWVP